MKTSETINELVAALAKASAEFKPIRKDAAPTSGPLAGKKYASLDSVLESVTGALIRNGLVLIQGSEGGDMLVTRLAHSSGQWIETRSPIFEGQQKGAQGWGSGLTYARRYSVLAILSVAPDDDDDGASADGRRPQSAAPAPQEQSPLRTKAIEYAKSVADHVKAADRHALMEIENRENGSIIQLSKDFPDVHARLQKVIDERWKALDAHQAPPRGDFDTPPQTVNGSAH